MVRRLEDIQKELISAKEADDNLAELTSTSKASVWRLLLYVVAFSIQTLEQLIDQHRKEVNKSIANQKSGTLGWYRSKALAFQYGFDLKDGTDKFNDNTATEEQILASKIIKSAAVSVDTGGVVIIKIAGENDGQLAPVSEGEKISVVNYFKEIKFAGDKIMINSSPPDELFLNMKIYIDPLVLDVEGNSIIDGGRPVEIAVNQFIRELPFNGELVVQDLVDKIQLVEGIKIVHIIQVQSRWVHVITGGYVTASTFDIRRIPESGYYVIENFENIRYVV